VANTAHGVVYHRLGSEELGASMLLF